MTLAEFPPGPCFHGPLIAQNPPPPPPPLVFAAYPPGVHKRPRRRLPRGTPTESPSGGPFNQQPGPSWSGSAVAGLLFGWVAGGGGWGWAEQRRCPIGSSPTGAKGGGVTISQLTKRTTPPPPPPPPQTPATLMRPLEMNTTTKILYELRDQTSSFSLLVTVFYTNSPKRKRGEVPTLACASC